MQLLQDVFIIENLQILNEGTQDGIMKIKGVFGRCNEKNNNGRIYPTGVVQGQLEKIQPFITERRLCGELDHPQNDTVKLSNASHLITNLELKGNELLGEAEVLKTPAGLTAQALINGGVKIGISSRGMGTLSEDHNGDKIVNEDFKLVTFDLVADPSTRGAYPGLSESTESKFAREIQSKLQKECNFVTLLESRMRKAYKPWIEEAHKKLVIKISPLTGSPKKLTPKGPCVETTQAFELVKADGHWHRIAEILSGSMREHRVSLPRAQGGGRRLRNPATQSSQQRTTDVAANIRRDLGGPAGGAAHRRQKAYGIRSGTEIVKSDNDDDLEEISGGVSDIMKTHGVKKGTRFGELASRSRGAFRQWRTRKEIQKGTAAQRTQTERLIKAMGRRTTDASGT